MNPPQFLGLGISFPSYSFSNAANLFSKYSRLGITELCGETTGEKQI
jgi:hypothetical protein